LPRKAKKLKRRVVVDTSVLVAGISGFKETYIPGKNPSADVLHKWAEEHNFIWLSQKTSWTSTRKFSDAFAFAQV
jgi:hypothetical protein